MEYVINEAIELGGQREELEGREREGDDTRV